MRRAVRLSFLLVLLAWLFLGTRLVQAQTPSGSANCQVPSSQSENEAETGVGPKVVIDDLHFDAPIHLLYSDLEPTIAAFNRLGASADSKFEWLDEFLEVPIRGVWSDQGYFKVMVNGRAEPRGGDAAHQHFSVILHVDEGPQYRLGTIEFKAVTFPPSTNYRAVSNDPSNDSQDKPPLRRRLGETDSEDKPTVHGLPAESDSEQYEPPIFPASQLRALIPMQEGDILDVGKIREGLDALRKLYGSHGYIDFAPTPETEIDDMNQVVNIRMVLDEQIQYHIRSIAIEGLEPSKQNALVWKIHPGDVFNPEVLEQFFEDNKSLLPEGPSRLNSELRRNPKEGTVDVTLRLRDCQHGSN
jgi:hypothetical protein